MAPSRVVAGGIAQSPASSGIFFQGDGHVLAGINSHLSPSFGNSTNSIPGTGCSTLGPASGDVSNLVLNGVASSGPSIGASSLVTDANSAFSGGPHLQRSASINNDSYMRLPASPMSFSSNNISLSGSSVIDGSSLVQQGSQQDQSSQLHQGQQQQHGGSSATSLLQSQNGHGSLAMAARLSNSFISEPNLSQVQKKQRLDIKQEDILKQQVMQQFMQRQAPLQLQGQNPHLQALLQEQRLRQQQQQILQSMPQMQRAQLQQQQQLQLRHSMQQQGMQQPLSAMKRPSDSGVCSRRLMQYLYHQRQRPPENTIAYWRKFVKEYYSPRAKKRWCLSLYENVGQHALGVFPQTSTEAWKCDICGSKAGRGFEATYEVLPRLNDIKFESGVIDELLFLDSPHESRFASGVMMLEYGKAVQESVYAQLRVVREGHLRIIFSQDLKILSWEFCARRHEELLPRKIVAPHVNQMLQAAQKCQSTIAESGSDGVSQEDLQTNSNMVLTAGRLLARSLELQSLNDLGFSKRYVRCLQISEVVNSMKDLIDFSADHKAGPIDALKNYPRHASAAKFQLQKMQEAELANTNGLPTDRNTLNRLMAMHPGLNNSLNSNNPMVNRGSAVNTSAQAALALSNYQNLVRQQNSSFQGPSASGSVPSSSGISNLYLPTQLQNQRSLNTVNLHQQNQSQSQPSPQHHMIQQFLHESTNSNGANSKVLGSSVGPTPSRSNGFNNSSAALSNNNESKPKTPEFTQNLHLPEDLVQDIANEYTGNEFFNSDFDDNLGYDWKA